MKRIVTFGGGTGQFTLLSGLKMIGDVEVTAIVTMADSGGSSGVLRTERGALPPGDILRCLIALATADGDVIHLFEHRLGEGGGIGGHTIGNIALTGAAEQQGGNFLSGIETLRKLLSVRGCVLPVTTDDVDLCALLSDGSVIRGEHHIDCPEHDHTLRIRDLWLEPSASPLPDVLEAIANSDLIVVGPGDLFTSVIPNVLVHGIPEALTSASARIVFVMNAMTKRGETDGFSAEDFVRAFERYAKRPVDVIVCNTWRPAADILAKYRREGAVFIEPILGDGFTWDERVIVPFPLLADGTLARHDATKLAHAIRALL